MGTLSLFYFHKSLNNYILLPPFYGWQTQDLGRLSHLPQCTLLTWIIINISIMSIRFLNLYSFHSTTLSPTMPQIVWQIMLHLFAKLAGILSMLNITQLTLSNEDYLCQGDFEDNPIQISIILDENKLINWSKSFFFLVEINFHGKYRSFGVVRSSNLGHGGCIIQTDFEQILWLNLLHLSYPETAGTLHWINSCSNNPGSFSKTYTHCICSLQLYTFTGHLLKGKLCVTLHLFPPGMNLPII